MPSERVRRHAGALALFALLTISWTWPLVRHLHDAIPGRPGDNFSFLWYLWWMRQALASPDVDFFHTTWLFFPFGASIANNPHTALPAFAAATLLGSASVITAQNVLILAHVFANMAVMYALAVEVTEDVGAATLAGVIFGLSPYTAAHVPGHFELLAIWTIPAFALFLRRSCLTGSISAALGAAAIAAATAYTSYYYFVYQAFFALVFLIAWTAPPRLSLSRRSATVMLVLLRRIGGAGAIGFGLLAVWTVSTGGGTIAVGNATLSATQPRGSLTWMWLSLLAWALLTWRVGVTLARPADESWKRNAAIAGVIVAGVVLATAPLLLEAARLMSSGTYVTPTYYWRSAPRGIDLLAPLAGHPHHALLGSWASHAYVAMHLDPIEAVGWLGIVPLLLLIGVRPASTDAREQRVWRAVAVAFAVWAAGPFLTIGGFDTALTLPEVLVRWIPFVANARMPGRAIVGVFLALAMLVAMRVRFATGRLSKPGWRWIALAAVVAEYWIAPVQLTPLDRPLALRALAREPAGAVCEVPFGVGDGLSGTGSQDRRLLYEATIHEHPVVGGFLGRMPPDADERYERMPIVGDLLRLSTGRAVQGPPVLAGSPCSYLIVRSAATRAMQAYVDALPRAIVAHDAERMIYRLQLP